MWTYQFLKVIHILEQHLAGNIREENAVLKVEFVDKDTEQCNLNSGASPSGLAVWPGNHVTVFDTKFIGSVSQTLAPIQSIGYLFSVLCLDHCQQLTIDFRHLPFSRASQTSFSYNIGKTNVLNASQNKNMSQGRRKDTWWYCARVCSTLCDLELLESLQLKGTFGASTVINTHVAEKTRDLEIRSTGSRLCK